MAAGSPAARADQITLHALMEDVPESQIIEAMLPEFEKETGIKVQFQRLVYSEMHDKLVTQLTGQSSFYNVLEVDFLWAGEFPEAGWLADLQPFVDKTNFDLKPFIPAMMDLVGRHKGTLYMIPMYNYSMGLIYRTDLLGDAKIQAAYKSATGKDLKLPETLADYVELAKFMNANGGVTGSAMQGQRGDPNSMEFSNYLFSSGAAYLDKDGKVALNSPEAVKALELYVDNIQHGAQKGALSATLDDTFRLVMPGGHGESGGWGWAIPKNETPEIQDAAWKFISWVQSEKISIARALQGHAPVRQDVYENTEVLAKYPYYKQAEAVVSSGEPFPVFAYSAQYEDVLGRQLSLAASGEAKPADAIKSAADGLDDLLKKSQ